MDIMGLVSAVLPSIVVGVFMAYYNKSQNKKDKEREKKDEARRKESLLALEMQMATAKLAYALAMAVKRGTPNGEVEEGVRAYEEAKGKFLVFLNEQALNHLK